MDVLAPLKKVYHLWWDHKELRSRQKRIREDYLGRYRQMCQKKPRTVFLLMTPQHENLGDHAIALAETEFLKRHGIDYIEITGQILDHFRNNRVLSLMNGCPIAMQGGGYLGTLWPESEVVFREILKANPDSKIFLFPNTIYYESGPEGQESFEESKLCYNQHKNLYLYAREKISYERMRHAYRNVKLIPDMVFSLNKSAEQGLRSGCILSLRQDQERTRSAAQEEEVFRQAQSLFPGQVRQSDMIASRCIAVEEREEAVNAKLAEFAGARLVITDRLHGMVFCAITGTPCIVLNSKSPKVRGCYEWIRDLAYIRFVEDASQIADAYRSIPQKTHYYDNSHLMHLYQELADDMEILFSGR